jgi:hypothetical protein
VSGRDAPMDGVVRALAQMVPRSVSAEDERPEDRLRLFFPAPAFLQALDPSILLVLGERGTGKTELFEVLRHGGLAAVLNASRPGEGTGASDPGAEALTIGEDDWGHQAEVSKHFRTAPPDAGVAFWLGLLARRVATLDVAADCPPPAAFDAVLNGREVAVWATAATQQLGALYSWLEDVEKALEARGRTLFVCYDQLDRTTLHYAELFAPLRALLQFWFEQRRRWRRLRPKIFLRPDLFDAETLAFPDGSKFFRASYRELVWSRQDLYRMWVKRLINGPKSHDVLPWVRNVSPEMHLVPLPSLGCYPVAPSEALLRPLVHSLVGRYLGANARKGESYNWVPNHVQDAHQRMAPRSFLALWQSAATQAAGRLFVDDPPMRPEDLHQGLSEASGARIQELAEDDPWMEGLRAAFDGVRVPAERAELEQRLAVAAWPRGDRPPPFVPATQASLLLDHLVRRGVVAIRSDGRVSVPDLYLFGLGMKRKGGVRRAR